METSAVGSIVEFAPSSRLARVNIMSQPVEISVQSTSGSLTIESAPLVMQVDNTVRESDLGIYKPTRFADIAAATGKAAVSQAIDRIVQEGNAMAHLENKGRIIPQLAASRKAGGRQTSDSVDFHFMTPPSISWSGGGVRIGYQPGRVVTRVTPHKPAIDFLV